MQLVLKLVLLDAHAILLILKKRFSDEGVSCNGAFRPNERMLEFKSKGALVYAYSLILSKWEANEHSFVRSKV